MTAKLSVGVRRNDIRSVHIAVGKDSRALPSGGAVRHMTRLNTTLPCGSAPDIRQLDKRFTETSVRSDGPWREPVAIVVWPMISPRPVS